MSDLILQFLTLSFKATTVTFSFYTYFLYPRWGIRPASGQIDTLYFRPNGESLFPIYDTNYNPVVFILRKKNLNTNDSFLKIIYESDPRARKDIFFALF